MKGIIFNLLEEVVTQNHGSSTWDALLDATGSDGAYTSLGNYPDADMQALVTQAASSLGITEIAVQRWFGLEAMPLLIERYPAFFAAHKTTKTFVTSVNSIIHPEVRKIYPGADVPTFEFSDLQDNGLLMGYHSQRKLCALAQGFIEGAARHFNETADVEHLECMHKGDQRCLMRILFKPVDHGSE